MVTATHPKSVIVVSKIDQKISGQLFSFSKMTLCQLKEIDETKMKNIEVRNPKKIEMTTSRSPPKLTFLVR